MKTLHLWTTALALTLTVGAFDTGAGVIMISTRNPQDSAFSIEGVNEATGPGMATPGDVAMGSMFSDNGYVSRLTLDLLLGATVVAPRCPDATFPSAADILAPATPPGFEVSLVIMSGSSASAATPPPPPGIPLMMGEHVTLGNNSGRPGSIYMYNGTASNDPNESLVPPPSKYMKVLVPDHPILQGIPLDSQNRVKIWREPYPREESHIPAGGKRNFEYRWCAQAVIDAAPGVTVLGVLDGIPEAEPQRSVFAVVDVDGMLANGNLSTVRMVHMFINEQGSGGPRRVFNALTEAGRLILLRSAQWAMGETLTPVQSLGVIDVSAIGGGKIKLAWTGLETQSYRILASSDITSPTWQTIVDEIPGTAGVMSRTLDVSAVPSALFMRIKALP